jgi:DNA uptake protein ComE-like DNA-binding protein
MKIALCLFLSLLMCSLCGCTSKPQNSDQVRERAANATAELKQDTKAVAEGIRQGWTRDKSLDINAASKEDLQSLPGVTPRLAESIVSHRPYAKTSELVDKHIMSKLEYDKVADRITAK